MQLNYLESIKYEISLHKNRFFYRESLWSRLADVQKDDYLEANIGTPYITPR